MNPSVDMVRRVALALGEMRGEFVFTGGAVVPLYLDEHHVIGFRSTLDVDVVVQTVSRAAYYRLEAELREMHWSQPLLEDAPICRWQTPDGVAVDIMPVDPDILGFSNPWYQVGLRATQTAELDAALSIRVFSPPVFIATKIEAFRSRGASDWYASHDLEDIIALFEGRRALADEIRVSDASVRSFVRSWLANLLSQPAPHDIVEGHLSREGVRSGMRDVVMTRLSGALS